MKEVVTNKSQSAVGLLSQAIATQGLVFTSGFIHMTADGELVGDTTAEQLAQVMDNISAVLTEAGSGLHKIIKATIYVTDMGIVPELNKAWVTYFGGILPAREAIEVSALPLGAKIEVSVVAEA